MTGSQNRYIVNLLGVCQAFSQGVCTYFCQLHTFTNVRMFSIDIFFNFSSSSVWQKAFYCSINWHFPDDSVMFSSTFSCTYWPFIYLLCVVFIQTFAHFHYFFMAKLQEYFTHTYTYTHIQFFSLCHPINFLNSNF